MDTPLDEQYLTWLYARIGSVRERNKSKTYWCLFKQLYRKEFVWTVPNDDNRVEDGRDLRYEFLDECNLNGNVDPDWMGMQCSVLELLMGLSQRLSFEADRTPRYWFFELLKNLELDGCTDAQYKIQSPNYVNDIIEAVIWRTYSPDGRGGLFPLKYPPEDQRAVEIWYQLCAFILERV